MTIAARVAAARSPSREHLHKKVSEAQIQRSEDLEVVLAILSVLGREAFRLELEILGVFSTQLRLNSRLSVHQ